MAFKWPAKDPNEVLDYEHDWALRLEPGEAILGLPECIPEDGSDVVVDSSTLNGTVQKVWLSGGTVKESGDPERLTIRITTDQGRTYDEGIRVAIRER